MKSFLFDWALLFMILANGTGQNAAKASSNEAPPDFGPNVLIFDPSMPTSSIQEAITNVYNAQQKNQFGDRRDALVFKPGSYRVDVGVGFYTEVIGLGSTPDAVDITGNLHSDAALGNNNGTCNFWRGVTNLSVTPDNGAVKWCVSQATFMRQVHIKGNLLLHQNNGWVSGGWLANSKVDGFVDSGTQQQWITRNTQMKNWTGSNWNMVFVGVSGAPQASFPKPAYTIVDQTPVVKEKPFLMIDQNGNYTVRVPSLKKSTSGYDWAGGSVPGTTLPISAFYIAKPGVTASTLNSQLAAGKHLLFTPGIYNIDQTLLVTRANTIIMGIGLATLRSQNGVTTMKIGDVDGVMVSGVLFDAGETKSDTQMEVGTQGKAKGNASNPIVLHDVIFRVGGTIAGKTNTSVRINANNTVVDHTWVWRADHGTRGTVGWDINTADNGMVVNGDNVTIYGLFVEHYQKHQTLWNGNGGRTYMYQSEIPYDVPEQKSWMDGNSNGFASYKVSKNVKSHEACGLGIYSYFSVNESNKLANAIEAPIRPKVNFKNIITICLGKRGEITNVINNRGGEVNSGNFERRLAQ